jgi:hypothetical protein
MNKSRDEKGRYKKTITDEVFEGFAVYQDRKGYKIIWMDGKDVRLHVLVWERVNGQKPKGYEIHHIDENKGNYSLGNLQLLSHSDHQRVHAGWIMTEGEWTHKPCTGCGDVLSIDDYYKRKGVTPSPKCKPCHSKQTREWALNNPEKRRRIALDHYYRNKK